MEPKTIWFISKYYASPPNEGSGSTRVFQTMREMVKLGNKVIIFTSSVDPYAELDTNTSFTVSRTFEGVKFWLLSGIKYASSISLLRIISWIHFELVLFRDYAKEKTIPDIVIVSSPSILTIFNGLYLKRKYKAKLIFEVRDIWPLTLIEDAGMSRWNPFILIMGQIERLAYKYSNGILGTMPNLKQHVYKILGYNKNVGFAPMGVSNENLVPKAFLEESYIKKYIPKDKFLIIYAGTIGVANALETLFKCAQILEPETDIHFLLVGDGPLLKQYKKEYAESTNITFAPKIKKSQVHSLLLYADVLYFSVANSEVWQYGQSLNKLIDYMKASKPIIASFSGFPSMLNESGCGVFVPSGNAELLREEIDNMRSLPVSSRIRMGEKGKQWLLENRNYSTIAQNLLKYFEDLRN
jgi:glycosyltransferase involved in cell wall biosynthesis